MKNFRIIAAILALIFCFSFYMNPACATQLPQPNVEYLKSKFPNIAIRFDGLVELPDHTIYLPVLPLSYGKVEDPAAIVQTIPAKTDFVKKPDMILFANNLALLKIIKLSEDQLTVNYSPEIPLSVKLGILPQDLLVPKGLVLPTELKVILGDLKIAIKAKVDEDDLVFYGEPAPKVEKKISLITGKVGKEDIKGLPELDCIKNKVLYASNFKENRINIIDSKTGRINKNMKLPTIPSNMVLTRDGRYLLVTSMSLNKVFIIDAFTNLFLKEIEVGRLPMSILMPVNSQKVYVANRLSSSISEIDINNMVLIREIKVAGNPDNLTSAEDNQDILYNDTSSDSIYRLNLSSGLCTKVTQAGNISKMKQYSKYLFILSRSNEELIVFDLKKNEVFTRIKVGKKPVDFEILSKRDEIYVLAAGSDELNIINMEDYKLKETIALNSGGFPGKITIIEKENKALITNQDSYQIVIYDMDKENVLGYIPVSRNISFLQLSK